MTYSKYLRDNLVHSYADDDADFDDDMSTANKISQKHRNIHDPHIEVSDPNGDEEYDVGVDKWKYSTQKEFSEATNEEFNVNKGGYRETTRRRSLQDALNDLDFAMNDKEDDDE